MPEQKQQIAPQQDNEPDQIQRPAQYPTATRIENGIAYDISGKQLGPVGAPATQTPGDDFFVGLGAKIVDTPAPQSQQDPWGVKSTTPSDEFFKSLGGKVVDPWGVKSTAPTAKAQYDAMVGATQATGLSAQPKGTRSWIDQKLDIPSPTEVGNWFDNVSADLDNGTDLTWVGGLLRKMGAKGTSFGNSAEIGHLIAGPLHGPIHVAKAITKVGEHPIQAANELLQGVGETLGPLAVTQPETLPFVMNAQMGSKLGTEVAKKFGLDEDSSALVGNAAGLVAGGRSASRVLRTRKEQK
jgi:hypothetical protein